MTSSFSFNQSLGLFSILISAGLFFNFDHKLRYFCPVAIFATTLAFQFWHPDINQYGYNKLINSLFCTVLIIYPIFIVKQQITTTQFLQVIVFTCVSLLAFGVVTKIYGNTFWDRNALYGLHGSIVFGRFMALGAIISIVLFATSEQKIFLATTFIFIIATAWSQSKGPILTIGIIIPLMLSRSEFRSKELLLTITLSVLMSMVLLAQFDRFSPYFDLAQNAIIYSTCSYVTDDCTCGPIFCTRSTLFRIYLAIESVDIFKNSSLQMKLIGNGIGSFEGLTLKTISYPHNLFLELLIEFGLIGSFILLSVLALFFLSHKSAFFYPALLFFISSLISGDLLDSRYLLLFSILAWADRSNAIFTKKKVVKNK